MNTILLTNRYAGEAEKIVRSLIPKDFCFIMIEENTQEALSGIIGEADYILASGRVRLDKDILDKARKLKMIQRTGVGLDSLDLDEIKKRGIPLYINPGINAESVAEHALLLMLSCLKHLPQIHCNTANGIWKKHEQGIQTHELSGMTVGLIGMGHIAKALARLLNGFAVEICYYAPHRLLAESERQLGVHYAELEDLLSRADIVSLHCPLTEESRGMLDRDAFRIMKDGVIVINTARGGLIDTAALLEAIGRGKVAFAGLDVYDEEPPPRGAAIFKSKNVVLTPHISGITHESFYRMMEAAMRNIQKFDMGNAEDIAQFLYKG